MGPAVDLAAYHAAEAATAVAFGVAVSLVFMRRSSRALALVLLGSAGWAFSVYRWAPVVVGLGPLLVAGAVMLWFVPPGPGLAVGSVRTRDSDDRWRNGLIERLSAGLLWACGGLALAGVWLAVPDTEVPVVVMAGAAPVAAWAWRTGTPGTWPVRAAFISLVALGAVGGAGGRSAWVGALACAGLLLLPSEGRDWRLMLSVQAVIVSLGSRVVSRWEVGPAALASLALLIAGWVLLHFLSNGHRSGPRLKAGGEPY